MQLLNFPKDENFTISLWFKTTFNGKWTPADPTGLQGLITKGYETTTSRNTLVFDRAGYIKGVFSS